MSTGAVIALTLGLVALVGVVLLGIVAAVAVPSVIRARATANETLAVSTLRQVAAAEADYQAEHDRFAHLRELTAAGLLSPTVQDGAALNGFHVREVSVGADAFEIALDAGTGSNRGRSFNVTEDSVIRYVVGPTAPIGASGQVFEGTE